MAAASRRREVRLHKAGFVYEFHLRHLAGAGAFFPAEAHYTLRHRLP